MAVRTHVMLVLWVALYVHIAPVPVAGLRYALRAPVCPDTELRIPEPLRRTVTLDQRGPIRCECAGRGLRVSKTQRSRGSRSRRLQERAPRPTSIRSAVIDLH